MAVLPLRRANNAQRRSYRPSQHARCMSRFSGCTSVAHTAISATLVGATENVNPEKGAELSAGGFSNFFAQPSFQTDAVEAYLTKLGSEFSGRFNRSGRAYPDVSAQGQRYNSSPPSLLTLTVLQGRNRCEREDRACCGNVVLLSHLCIGRCAHQ